MSLSASVQKINNKLFLKGEHQAAVVYLGQLVLPGLSPAELTAQAAAVVTQVLQIERCMFWELMDDRQSLLSQVGLVAPEGIQHLMRRAVGPHRAELLLVTGDLVEAERALAIGLVDELAPEEQVTARAVAWLQALLKLPREPVLRTRSIARADLVAALAPESDRSGPLHRRLDGPRYAGGAARIGGASEQVTCENSRPRAVAATASRPRPLLRPTGT